MLITELFQGINEVIEIRGQADVHDLCIDSRKVKAGDLYYCQKGTRFDGHDFAAAVAEKGAAALVVSRFVDVDIPQILVKDVRQALSLSAAAFFGHPAKGMRIIGVTGTKGKTTTTYLIKAVLDAAGVKTGLIGTMFTMIGDKQIPGSLTTPEAIDFQRTLRMMRDEGVDTLVMEISANAVTLKRVYGVSFDIGVFTNFSQDHLDFYGTMDNYFAAKKAFFEEGYVKKAVINVDDERAADIVSVLDEYIPFGVIAHDGAYAKDINLVERGINYTMVYKNESMDLSLNLPGLFNVYNSMAAAICCLELGCSAQAVENGLEQVSAVPGRIELLKTDTPYRVILDYAHSPDSLVNILKAVRQFTSGRLIVLFGCGGNRDTDKRPVMGRIAGEMADFSILTSDNPRGEEPMEIIAQIEEGIKTTEGKYIVIEDRTEAIREGLKMAKSGDTLVLAGKGHETYQEVKGVKQPFDERIIVKQLLEEI
ncbi:MAG: UDP-N-acetylmuramoyl-L-alanyl-D-glutamate--2,6-diaminopimelate ligase [Clostridia bacterium]|nr:UDP-N-acetylmuramoyl-L-alanyl-D-glutamate--2,6-diaminopimelate ligase [Clostridia bacterium]